MRRFARRLARDLENIADRPLSQFSPALKQAGREMPAEQFEILSYLIQCYSYSDLQEGYRAIGETVSYVALRQRARRAKKEFLRRVGQLLKKGTERQ